MAVVASNIYVGVTSIAQVRKSWVQILSRVLATDDVCD